MFTNMGPAPNGRSGHAMASWLNKVFVLGGESYEPSKQPGWLNTVHMLDTGKIKYPSESRSGQTASRKTSNPKLAGSHSQAPTGAVPNRPLQNVVDSENRRAASPTGSEADTSQLNGLKASANKANGALSQSQQSINSYAGRDAPSPVAGQSSSITRKVSEQGRRAMSPINEQRQPERALSPTMGQRGTTAGQSNHTPPTRSQATLDGQSSTSPPQNVNISALRANARSPSPVQQASSLSRSMDGYGQSDLYNQPASQARQADSSNKVKWMQAALSSAVAKGFTLPDGSNSSDFGNVGDDKPLLDALLSLKRELADLRSSMGAEAAQAEQRLAAAQKSRAAALQEASFYRSKIAALESSSTNDLFKLERTRIAELEKKIVESGSAKAARERRLEEVESELSHLREAAKAAADREAASLERADAAEASYSRSLTDYAELQRRAHGNEGSLQEHLTRIASLESQLQQMSVQHNSSSTRLASADTTLQSHLRALEQTKIALGAANAHSTEMESLWNSSRRELEQRRADASQLEADLHSTSKQLQAATAQIQDLEKALNVSQQEASSLRQLTSGHLTEVLNTSRSLGPAPGADAGDDGRAQALQSELDQHRSIHKDAMARAAAAQAEMRESKASHIALERQITLLRSELAGLWARHASALDASSRSQALATQRDMDLREKARALETSEVRSGLLRSILIENGLSPDDHPESPSTGNTAGSSRKVAELEARLEQRSKAQAELQQLHDAARRDAESSRQRLLEAEERIQSLNRQAEELKLQSAGGSASSSAQEELDALREKHQQLETTHLKAVQYVKG